MKKLFLAIRHGDIAQVQEIIGKDPTLVHCTAKPPPKKDDGQSPLQLAFKSGNFVIADYLMDAGADVNFIDATSNNEWKAPVAHDAIMAAIGSAGVPARPGEPSLFEQAFHSLTKLIGLSANMRAQDSCGNNCGSRACLDANKYCPPDGHPRRETYVENTSRVLKLLVDAGVDFNEPTATRRPPVMVLAVGSPFRRLFIDV